LRHRLTDMAFIQDGNSLTLSRQAVQNLVSGFSSILSKKGRW
jgi:hypothetical protein